MLRFKVFDSKGYPIAFVKTYKQAEKERIKYLQRTNDNAYIVDTFNKKGQ